MKKRTGKPAHAKRVAKPQAPPAAETKPAQEALMTVRIVEASMRYAELTFHEPITEDSLDRVFASLLGQLPPYQPKRVLADLRDTKVQLSISDMNGLVKLIAANFADQVERIAIVLRPADVPADKFFEPALRNRGLPTLVTQDYEDAVGWITASLLRPH